MQCPKCGSENCQRLSVVYRSGTSYSFSSTGYGSGYSNSTSELASLASPPQREKIDFFRSFLVLGFSLMMLMMGLRAITHFDITTVFTGLVLGIMGGLGLLYLGSSVLKKIKYNMTQYHKDYQYWQNQWLCHKCGKIYYHEM